MICFFNFIRIDKKSWFSIFCHTSSARSMFLFDLVGASFGNKRNRFPMQPRAPKDMISIILSFGVRTFRLQWIPDFTKAQSQTSGCVCRRRVRHARDVPWWSRAGSGDWEHPQLARAKGIPGSRYWPAFRRVTPSRCKRTGPHEIIVVVVVELFIYLYIL